MDRLLHGLQLFIGIYGVCSLHGRQSDPSWCSPSRMVSSDLCHDISHKSQSRHSVPVLAGARLEKERFLQSCNGIRVDETLKVMSCCSMNKWCHPSKGYLHAESR
jgi:hypothetical protein